MPNFQIYWELIIFTYDNAQRTHLHFRQSPFSELREFLGRLWSASLWPIFGKRGFNSVCRSISFWISCKGKLKNSIEVALKLEQRPFIGSDCFRRQYHSKLGKLKCLRNHDISECCSFCISQFPEASDDFPQINSQTWSNKEHNWWRIGG